MNKNKLLTLCIDVEVFDILNEFGIGVSNDDMARISLEGLNELRKIIDEFNIKATFFVTKDIVAMFPEEVGILAKEGHEIALHSVINEQEKEDMIFKELTEQKTYIEKAIGRTIFGHKSHKFLPIPLGELEKIGLLYDNSLHPTYVPGRYCNIFKPRSAYKEAGMIEVPVTVTPLFRLPFSCFWFRVLGLYYAKLCTNLTYSRQDYINIYFHNWEFGDVSDRSLKWPHKLLLQNLGDRMIVEFRQYLQWIIKNEVSIITMLGYVQNQVSK